MIRQEQDKLGDKEQNDVRRESLLLHIEQEV
jgi:hypothetical protein